MELVVRKADLLRELQLLQGIVERKITIPVLANVLVEAGDRIPADGRLLEAYALEVDESALTGESVPVAKDAPILVEKTAPIAERVNCAFMNTVVTRGRGVLLVTATGKTTQMGRVAGMLEEAVQPPTPLQIQLDRLGKRIAVIAVAAVIFGMVM